MPNEHWSKPSHFIGSSSCHFGITDAVNGYVISTVGDYRPVHLGGPRATIGLGRYYETMVFRDSGKRCNVFDCGCGIPIELDYHDLDFEGYRTEEEARAGHAAMVAKYAAMVPA